ncbi:hypothetical protein [Corynebacterium glutamicum]|uniref:hypothetical protein n=1 Tax=Corynebacterium glutamicum TaxID=1718 RepID=UPI00117F7072|nr:hypothetical protein [Corynebacterium glutamicum]
MKKKRRYRGQPPTDKPSVPPSGPPRDPSNPKISFRLIQPRWGVEELNADQARAFLLKWEKRSSMTWNEIMMAHKHGLGSETLPAKSIIPDLPEWVDSSEKLLVLRYEGRLPQVGIRIGDTFEVIWIEPEFNTLYSHDGKNRR